MGGSRIVSNSVSERKSSLSPSPPVESSIFTIGTVDFSHIRCANKFYIDKTKLILDLIYDSTYLYKLMLRPRGFGKTTTLSMIRYFFDKTLGDTSNLFNGLYVNGNKKKHLSQLHINKYPVLFVSFKDIEAHSFDEAKILIESLISRIYNHYKKYVFQKYDDENFREKYQKIVEGNINHADIITSLSNLSQYLYDESDPERRVILLIDEYDIPIKSGFHYGYLEEISDLVGGILHSVLKDGNTLQFAVVTGSCVINLTRIQKQAAILTPFSIIDNSKPYSDAFGFTEKEIRQQHDRLFGNKFPNSDDFYQQLFHWYGIKFAGHNLLHPSSLICFLTSRSNELIPTIPSFSNNHPMYRMLNFSSVRVELKALAEKKIEYVPEVKVDSNVTISEVNLGDRNSVYSFLFFNGLLCIHSENNDNVDSGKKLKIPNNEIADRYLTFFGAHYFKDHNIEHPAIATNHSIQPNETAQGSGNSSERYTTAGGNATGIIQGDSYCCADIRCCAIL